ncbi:MAG: DUF4347 domain-containing protein, partial [Gammaproteobacteria bacterium]|nr:DUF4347 domain-containing protein [Gammaproteobacteria bacterium]
MNKQYTPKTLPGFRRKPLITALESRILLDGAAVATAVEMTTDVAFQQDAVHQPGPDQAVHFSDGSLALAPTQIKAGDPSQNHGRKEVAFVDSNVEDYQTLVDGIGAGIEVQLIDCSQDGLAQLAVWAQQNSGYDAIHILSHGEQGQISLGTLTLNMAVVEARSAELANLGAALTADGDLLLYGCEVTSEGSQTFVTALATATGADVAASEDLTGTQARGGDWQLEYHQGDIETEGLNVESYDGVLAEPVQVSVFSYPGLNGSGTQTDDENANLTSIIQAQIDGGANYTLDTSITSFTDPALADKLAASGFFFMTDMENQDPTDIGFFPESARTIFRDWVNDGGVIMMTGTGGTNDVDFLNLIFGWDLSNATHSDNSPRVDSNAAGTPFENVTADYLPPMNASETINKGTVENFKTIYGSDTNAAVATIEYGSGHVIYMGFDFYGAGTEGYQYSSSWVQEIIPAAMEYSAALAGSGDVDEDQTYTFSADAFKSGSTVLSQVKITSLPTHGSLSLSGTAISADQIITSEQYDLLTYTPNENFNGEDGFNWQGYDGEEYGADTSYDLTVSPVNDAPIFGAANTSTQVSVFSSPNLNGSDASPSNDNENANLSSIVQSVINEGGEYSLDTSITGFTDAGFSDKLNASGFFFMTDMEKGDPRDTEFLPESAKTTMKDWVGAGGVMMMTGTYGSNDTDFLNTIFGWDLTTQSGSSWNLNTSNAAGTPFAGGPSSLDNPSATDSIGKGTVEGFSAIYGTDDNATVAVINYGSGTVIFLGFDFYDTGISGTGFTDTAPQYGADVSDGGQRTNAWVTEIIPRAMEYSANLSASVILSQSDSGLSATDSLTVTDVDLTDEVNVSVSSVTAVQRDASGDLISSSATEPDSATLLAMLSLPSQPVVDAESTEGTLSWTFDSGDETFGYLGVGEQLVLTYTLTADDGNGGTATQNIEITITGNNDAPVAENDAVIAIEAGGVANGSTGSGASGNVLSNDSDVDDGDTKTVTGVVFDDTSGTVGSVLNGQYGSLTLNANGSYSYVIDENNAAVQA